MLSKVKLALRISHNLLDSEILDTISTARAEMIRSGIAESKANDDADDLIVTAIKTYCLSVLCGDKDKSEKYNESWLYQLDNIRKS